MTDDFRLANSTLPITPRLRILFPAGLRLGPGKIELLAAVGETGSISAAGRALGMSYRRAWLLVDEANRMFKEPLVLASAGGSQGGGAQLTNLGRRVIAAYRAAEEGSKAAIAEAFAGLAESIETEARPQPE